MSLLTIFLRSLLVLFVLALLFIPIRINLSDPAPAEASIPETNTIETHTTLPIEATGELTPEIFERPVFAYLKAERQDFIPASTNRPVDDTANRLIVAKDLAEQKQFERALIILGNVKPEDAGSYDVRFLRARIMSWAGQHDGAEYIFSGLWQEFPQDADIMVSYGYLKYYKGEHRTAEALFSQVLARYPGYTDAQDGLRRVRLAMQNP